jgi:chromosome segregation ATPase
MPKIDLNELAAGVTAVLAQREADSAQRARDAERAAAERLAQEQVEAELAEKARRDSWQKRLMTVEAEQRNCFSRCQVLEEQIKQLPGQLAFERSRQATLLRELYELRQKLDQAVAA